MSFADSKAMASEMKTSAETLSALKKTDRHSQFGCFVKNFTSSALPITVEFGLLEQQPKLSKENKQLLLEQNREKYCIPASEISFGDVAEAKSKAEKKAPAKTKEEKPVVEPAPKQEAVTVEPEPVDIPEK